MHPRTLLCGMLLILSSCKVLAQDVPPTQAEPAAQTAPAPSAEPSEPTAQPDPLLTTPRAAVLTFVESMKSFAQTRDRDDLDLALRTLAVSDGTTGAGLEEASQLYAVLLRLGDLTLVPEALPDSLPADQTTYQLYPANSPFLRVNLTGYRDVQRLAPDSSIELSLNERGEWRFSQATLSEIGQMLAAVESIAIRGGSEEVLTPAQWIRRHMVPPALKEGRLLKIEYWQWIAIAVVLLAGFLLDWFVRLALGTLAKIAFKTKGTTPDPKIVRNAVRPFGLFASALVFYFGVDYIGLPAAFVFIARVAVTVFLVLAAVQAALRLVDLLADLLQRRAVESESKLDDVLVPLFRKVAKVIVFIMAVISIAEYFELPYLPLLSGLGIGGLAFAFAAKDTIENFFGSIAVIADRPFEVGDWVVIGDAEGTVESLGIRSTRIRTFYNSQITVPNSELVRARVDNYGRRNLRRYKTMLNLAYSTPPARIEAFCEGIRELVRQHPYTHKASYHVWLNEFGPHSLDVLVYMFFQTPDWATELRERHRFILDVLRLASAMGVEFAFPTQTLHLRQPSEDLPEASPLDEQPDSESGSRSAGSELARELVAGMEWKGDKPGAVRFEPPKPREG